MSLSGTVTGREPASGHAEQHRWPGMPAAGEHSGRTAPSRAAFWLVAGIFRLLFCAAGRLGASFLLHVLLQRSACKRPSRE